MKILCNAHNLKMGGGETVGLSIIKAINSSKFPHQFEIILPKKSSYLKFVQSDQANFHFIPEFFTNSLIGRLLCNTYIAFKAKKLGVDAIFSMGNYAVPLKKKQLLFLHWPYIVYPDSIAWKHMGLVSFVRRKLRALQVGRLLKHASAVTLQTPLMKEQFLKNCCFNGEVHVVESTGAPIIKPESESDELEEFRYLYPDYKFVLCISKYYDHKNLEILISVAEKIRKERSRVKIFINLEPGQNKRADALLKEIAGRGLENTIINLGYISQERLYAVYKSADAFILPTLLESFGIIYHEAMLAGLPVFTSDLDFAHYMCGEAAFYFDPLNGDSVYQTLIDGLKDSRKMQLRSQKAKERAKEFKSWEEITNTYISILENL